MLGRTVVWLRRPEVTISHRDVVATIANWVGREEAGHPLRFRPCETFVVRCEDAGRVACAITREDPHGLHLVMMLHRLAGCPRTPAQGLR